MMRRLMSAALLGLSATACRQAPDEPARAITADEARQLNEAADMLDANSVDLNAIDTNQNGSDPA